MKGDTKMTASISLTHREWMAVNRCTLELYAQEDLHTMRLCVLEQIGKLVKHQKSFFDLCGSQHAKRVFFDPLSLNMNEKELSDYYNHYIEKDYTGWVIGQSEHSFAYRDSDFITEKLLQISQLYQEWLCPMGVHYGAGISLSQNGILYGSFTMFRSYQEGDFTAKEMMILEILTPHIIRRMVHLHPNGIRYTDHHMNLSSMQMRYLLTKREEEVLFLLMNGHSTKDIAQKLYIAPSTARKHLANLYQKLGVSSRAMAVHLVMNEQKKTRDRVSPGL